MADIGYIRVSSTDKDGARRQLEGVPLDKVFEDKASGTSRARQGLIECLAFLREGDTLHVDSLDRLVGNLKELLEIVTDMNRRGIAMCFHKDNLLFSDKSPTQAQLLQLLDTLVRFEKACIRERQQDGILQSKLNGKRLGRPAKLSKKDHKDIMQRLCNGETPSEIAQSYHVDVSSIYRIRSRARAEGFVFDEENTNGPTQKAAP